MRPPPPVVEFERVSVFHRSGSARTQALVDVSWTVRAGEHWAIAGPNAAGKSTIVRIAAARLTPSRGRAAVLGEELGRTRIHDLRRRIALVDARLARQFYPHQTAVDVVVGGLSGAIVVRDRAPESLARAKASLRRFGVAGLAERRLAECSEGERMRILLARAFVTRPRLLVLDEPAAGLDLAARELLLASVGRLAGEDPGLTTIVVSHHLEELPPSLTHALLVRDGEVVAAGPAAATLSSAHLSACYGVPITVDRAGNRYFARLAGGSPGV